MRVYPSASELLRTPQKDVVLPLSKPIVGVSGKVHEELHIPAGTVIAISPLGYNLYVRPLERHLGGGPRVEIGSTAL